MQKHNSYIPCFSSGPVSAYYMILTHQMEIKRCLILWLGRVVSLICDWFEFSFLSYKLVATQKLVSPVCTTILLIDRWEHRLIPAFSKSVVQSECQLFQLQCELNLPISFLIFLTIGLLTLLISVREVK